MHSSDEPHWRRDPVAFVHWQLHRELGWHLRSKGAYSGAAEFLEASVAEKVRSAMDLGGAGLPPSPSHLDKKLA